MFSLFSFEGISEPARAPETFNHAGGNSGEATPVPIPNTVVKLSCADDTWWATARESRTLPAPIAHLALKARWVFL